MAAAIEGNVPRLIHCLNNGITTVDQPNDHGSTALMHAAVTGQEVSVEFLLWRGANPNTVDKSGRSPLWYAAEKGHGFICELLLMEGAFKFDVAELSFQNDASAFVEDFSVERVRASLQHVFILPCSFCSYLACLNFPATRCVHTFSVDWALMVLAWC